MFEKTDAMDGILTIIRFPIHYDGDILALWGVLAVLYERLKLKEVFLELYEEEYRESEEHGDSAEYLEKLCEMGIVARNLDRYDTFEGYMEEMLRIAELVPMIGNTIRKIVRQEKSHSPFE